MPQLVESIGNDRDMFSSLKPQWTGNVSSLDHWGDHFQPSMAHGLPGEHGGFKWVNGTFQIFPVPSGNPTYKKHIFPSTISYMDGFKQLPLLCFIKKRTVCFTSLLLPHIWNYPTDLTTDKQNYVSTKYLRSDDISEECDGEFRWVLFFTSPENNGFCWTLSPLSWRLVACLGSNT